MNAVGPKSGASPGQTLVIAALVVWAVDSLLAVILAGSVAQTLEAFQMPLLGVFALLHAWVCVGRRNLICFFLFTFFLAFAWEACSIATGFPFGFYHHNVPGLKPLGVPISVAFLYVIYGWVAWAVACLMVRDGPNASGGMRYFTPVVASFVFTGFDFVFDPLGANVFRLYTWTDPHGFNGIPLSNYLGWLFTCWTFYQCYALTERHAHEARVNKLLWLCPCIAWLVVASRFVVIYLHGGEGSITAGGRVIPVADIFETAVIVAIMSMAFPALVAMFRLHAQSRPTPSVPPGPGR